jgi:hypothetical protein
MLRVISLGAGVQSTTMALMAAHGEIRPMPDCAIFADTQSEPAVVYEHLKWLMSPNVLPFPVHIVTAGNLEDDVGSTNENRRYLRSLIPAFVRSNEKSIDGLVTRQCTRDYKITPVTNKIRGMLGIAGKRSPKTPVAEVWIGISTDEAMRMKPAPDEWRVHRHPLIEQRMSRGDCLEWLQRNGYPKAPKSACIFCPYHSNAQWRDLKNEQPEEFARAVALDERLRTGRFAPKGELYLHRSARPLVDVDFTNAEDRGQLNLFNNECEGMCGV